MNTLEGDAGVLMRLMELSDSAFPVGGFSFSSGLETAAACGMVTDAATLEEFTSTAVESAAQSDAVASIAAFRAARNGDYDTVAEADMRVLLSKLNAESRSMSLRMGHKMTSLAAQIFSGAVLDRWAAEVTSGTMAGTFAVAQAVAAEAAGVDERSLFAMQLYSAAQTVLNAALRCVRVSHIDTQRILCALSYKAEGMYAEARTKGLDDMQLFAPQTDILFSLHEKGNQRMFMN